jgi:predicted amino acid racemase
MSTYPRIVIHLDRIARNARETLELCHGRGISVAAITKGVCGDLRIAATLIEAGVNALGDSRLENLKKYHILPCEKWLIRIPMLSECREVVQFADVSLVSEALTLQYLDLEAHRQGRKLGILLMVEMGDRREGCLGEDELAALIARVDQSPGLYLKGIGTNLGCYGFIRTTKQKMDELSRLVESVSPGRRLLVSGGNSSALGWMKETGETGRVNHLRLGESILFGRERRDFTQLPGTVEDAFELQAEIVELKKKPSLPEGEIGRDSFDNSPHFENLGEHWRAICAVGKQDIEPDLLCPVDGRVSILGASFDHMLLQVPQDAYHLGDILSFRMRYPAVVRAMTSEYILKEYRGSDHGSEICTPEFHQALCER